MNIRNESPAAAQHSRQVFLSALFQILDQQALPYSVLRNYQGIYEDASSDVDLVVEPENSQRAGELLAEAAAKSGHQFAHYVRHICDSFIYWHPHTGFLRIDIQREVRWRTFPVLTANAIVKRRRKFKDFYIPHPADEAVILLVAAISRGDLSNRYREQLARLYQQLPGSEEFQRDFTAAFGAIGREFARCQAQLREEPPRPDLWQAARLSIITNTLRHWHRFRAMLGFSAHDLKRMWERLRQPPGISLACALATRPPRDMDAFLEAIKFVFPKERASLTQFQVTSPPAAPIRRLSLRLRLRRLYVLFKGGVFLTSHELREDGQIQKTLRKHNRPLYPERTFVWAENSRQQTLLGHLDTGFMAEFGGASGNLDFHDQVMRFITRILNQSRLREKRHRKQRGVLVVLVGLDGSGKTTVARQLCCLDRTQELFSRIRYYHWQLRIFRDGGFPLPEFKNVPRKTELRRNFLRGVLSIIRLLKNLCLTTLAYWIRVRSLLRSNSLVVVDRYYYNYFLDPVSVKYYGPAGLLGRVRSLYPKPDLVVVLKAPPETLLSRKQELSPEEIIRQTAVLNQLQFDARHTLEVDASRPAADIARTILDKIAGIAT